MSHRMPAEVRAEFEKADLFGGALADVVWGWMSGETLTALNARLGGNVAKPDKVPKARKFVTRVIPAPRIRCRLGYTNKTSTVRGRRDESKHACDHRGFWALVLSRNARSCCRRGCRLADRWSRQRRSRSGRMSRTSLSRVQITRRSVERKNGLLKDIESIATSDSDAERITVCTLRYQLFLAMVDI